MTPIIYIIDDNFVSEFATRMVLDQSNIHCEIFCFDEGHLALSNLIKAIQNNENVPNIILLDLNMPIMDGWGFLEKITDFDLAEYDIAIYMVSTFTNSNTRKKAMSHPLVKGYYERPLSITNIQKMMSAMTDKDVTE